VERCSNCGAVLEHSAGFCPNCRKIITALPSASSPREAASLPPDTSAPFNGQPPQRRPQFVNIPKRNSNLPPIPNPASGAGMMRTVPPANFQPPPFAPPQSWQSGPPSTNRIAPQQGTPWQPVMPANQPSQTSWDAPSFPQQPLPGIGQPAPERFIQQKTKTKKLFGLKTQTLLLAIVCFVILAGAAGALVLTLHSHPSGAGNTASTSSPQSGTTVTSGTTATTVATRTTVTTSSTPPKCTSSTPGCTSSPIVSQASSIPFTITGQMAGSFTPQFYEQCNQVSQGNNGKVMITTMDGILNGGSYRLGFIIPYTGPGVYHQSGNNTTEVFLVARQGSGGLINQGRLPMTISITNSGKAGSIDADLGSLSSGQPAVGHVTGKYSCGA